MNLFEWQAGELPPDIRASEFKSYLSEVWASRHLFSSYNDRTDDPDDDAERQRFLHFDGQRFRTRNYVGFIRYKGYEMNIYPSVFKKTGVLTPADTTLYINHLFYWLSHCQRVQFPFSLMSFEQQDTPDFLEALIHIFAGFTEQVLLEKPYQRYEEITEETTFMRGRLAMPEYIRENLSTGNWQHFHCTHEPFLYDNLFNRIVKHTAQLLLGVTHHPLNRERLSAIRFILDEVSDVPCSYEDCDRVKPNRLFEEVNIVLSMCKMFLANQAINKSEQDDQNFCFLLPMEMLFEDFIAGFLKKHCWQEWHIRSQVSDLFLAKTAQAEHVFNLRQDIVLRHRRDEQKQFVIDTKYKFREYRPDDRKADIKHSDMYQMLGYAVKGEWENAVLLYPRHFAKSPVAPHEFVIESKALTGQIKVYAFDVSITAGQVGQVDALLKDQLEDIFRKLYGEL